jgi:hypothetical protein
MVLRRFLLPILLLVAVASLVLNAADVNLDSITARDGTTYKQVTIQRCDTNGVSFLHSDGVASLRWNEIPKDVQMKLGHDSEKIEAEKRSAAEKAAQKVAEQERKRAEAAKRKKAEIEEALRSDDAPSFETLVNLPKRFQGQTFTVGPVEMENKPNKVTPMTGNIVSWLENHQAAYPIYIVGVQSKQRYDVRTHHYTVPDELAIVLPNVIARELLDAPLNQWRSFDCRLGITVVGIGSEKEGSVAFVRKLQILDPDGKLLKELQTDLPFEELNESK